MIQEGATRWTSTFRQLQRFKELYEFIKEVANTAFIDAVTALLPRSRA